MSQQSTNDALLNNLITNVIDDNNRQIVAPRPTKSKQQNQTTRSIDILPSQQSPTVYFNLQQAQQTFPFFTHLSNCTIKTGQSNAQTVCAEFEGIINTFISMQMNVHVKYNYIPNDDIFQHKLFRFKLKPKQLYDTIYISYRSLSTGRKQRFSCHFYHESNTNMDIIIQLSNNDVDGIEFAKVFKDVNAYYNKDTIELNENNNMVQIQQPLLINDPNLLLLIEQGREEHLNTLLSSSFNTIINMIQIEFPKLIQYQEQKQSQSSTYINSLLKTFEEEQHNKQIDISLQQLQCDNESTINKSTLCSSQYLTQVISPEQDVLILQLFNELDLTPPSFEQFDCDVSSTITINNVNSIADASVNDVNDVESNINNFDIPLTLKTITHMINQSFDMLYVMFHNKTTSQSIIPENHITMLNQFIHSLCDNECDILIQLVNLGNMDIVLNTIQFFTFIQQFKQQSMVEINNEIQQQVHELFESMYEHFQSTSLDVENRSDDIFEQMKQDDIIQSFQRYFELNA